jgi:hypothetical protein
MRAPVIRLGPSTTKLRMVSPPLPSVVVMRQPAVLATSKMATSFLRQEQRGHLKITLPCKPVGLRLRRAP